MKLFTKKRADSFKKHDDYFDKKNKSKEAVLFRKLWKKHKSKVALWRGVAFYKNYIPLYRMVHIRDCFKKAEKGEVYAWNFNDLPRSKFIEIIMSAFRFSDVKSMSHTADPGGF